MKCIRKHGEIRRVKDKEAIEKVTKHGWEYCPKSEWKKVYKN